MEGQGQVQGQVDVILDHLGPLRMYAMVQWTGYALCMLPIAFQLFSIVFTGRDIPHVCSPVTLNATLDHMTEVGPSLISEIGEPFAKEMNRNSTYNVSVPLTGGIKTETTTGTMSERNEQEQNNFTGSVKYLAPKDLSIASEFGLVCDKAPLLGLSQMTLGFGQLLSSLLLPPLSERFGRKGILIATHSLLAVSGLVVAFAPSYGLLIAAKLFVGIGIIGLRLSCTTGMLEVFPTRYRSVASAVSGGALFALSSALMAPVAFALQALSWRTMQLVFTSVSLLLVMQIIVLDEPLRALLAKNKRKEALKVIRKSARWNKKDMQVLQEQLGSLLPSEAPTVVYVSGPKDTADDDMTKKEEDEIAVSKDSDDCADEDRLNGDLDLLKRVDSPAHHCKAEVTEDAAHQGTEEGGDEASRWQEIDFSENPSAADSGTETRVHNEDHKIVSSKSPTRRMTMLDILKHRRMRFNLCFIILLWFLSNLVYFGLYLTAGSLVGDLYLNFGLNGLVEIPACVLYLYTLERYGRKWTLTLCLVTSGICLVSSGVCRLFEGQEVADAMSTILSLMGKAGASGTMNIVIMYTGEIFPTICRTQTLGVGSAAGRVGIMIAPFLITLAQYFAWAPGVVFGASSFLAVCCLYFLPESRGRELPQTPEDLDKWYQKDKDDTEKP